jgi:hypothetical protein
MFMRGLAAVGYLSLSSWDDLLGSSHELMLGSHLLVLFLLMAK